MNFAGNMDTQSYVPVSKYKAAPVQLTTWIHQAQDIEDPVQVLTSRLPLGAKEGDIMEVRKIENNGNRGNKLGPKVFFVVKPINSTRNDIISQAQVCI